MELWQRFTPQARRAVLLAHDVARGAGAAHLTTTHLLLGLLQLGEGVTHDLLHQATGLAALMQELCAGLPPDAAGADEEVTFSPAAQRALTRAYEHCRETESGRLDTGHLLLGLLREDPDLRTRLAGLGLTEERVRAALN